MGVHTLQSGVWKIALRFSPSRQGNSCQLLECSRENKQCSGCSLCLPSLPLLTLRFNPSPLETLERSSRGRIEEEEVNQSNVSSRLEALNSGPESAIFQLLSKNMCSRYGYRSPSKSAADRINHMSFIMALKKKGTFCVQHFVVWVVYTALQPTICLSTQRCVHIQSLVCSSQTWHYVKSCTVTRLQMITQSSCKSSWSVWFCKVNLIRMQTHSRLVQDDSVDISHLKIT